MDNRRDPRNLVGWEAPGPPQAALSSGWRELFLCGRDPLEGFQLNDRWDDQEATGLLSAALAEIDALSDELSPARAEALLDEFELDVGSAFLRQDLPAVKATCEEYQRRFRTLAKEAK